MCVRITLGCELKSRILGIIPNFLYLLYLYLGEVEGICLCPSVIYWGKIYTQKGTYFRCKAQLICIWITLDPDIEHIHYIQKILSCFFLVSIVNLYSPSFSSDHCLDFCHCRWYWHSQANSFSVMLCETVPYVLFRS